MTPKRNKKATKNKKGLAKIQKTVSKLREEYEAKYPFAVDYDEVNTPEGMPTFEEFINSKEAGRVYNTADPLWQYQKTTPMGVLAYQRWRGAKTSKDGKNYRTPYIATPTAESFSPSMISALRASGEAGDVAGTGGLTTNMDMYKEGHKKYLENRTTLDKIKGIAGSVVPPANYISGRGASLGGRNIPEAINAALLLKAFKGAPSKVLSGEDFTAKELATMGGSFMGIPVAGSTDVIVPTGGFKINPFSKAVRGLKKDAKKSNKKLDNKLSKGSKQYNIQLGKEKADFERQAKLYEKRYGFKPAIPEMTQGFRPAQYQAGEGRRGQNRNPIFLKNGGVVPFMKPKKK